MLVVITLVALRLGVGWQFYQEGVAKFRDPKPYSAVFLGSAKGPFAPAFQTMIWDSQGNHRLHLEQTLAMWKEAPPQAARHFGLDDKQTKAAEQLANRYSAAIRQFFAETGEDRKEYRGEMVRIERELAEPDRMQVASLGDQVAKRESQQKAKLRGWLTQVDAMWASFERDLNQLATADQFRRGSFALERPGRRFMDSEAIDGLVRWFDLSIGLLLIAGLFTRVAAVAGAAFLGSIVVTQPPWVADAAPTYYQINLILALLVVAAVGAGRFAGLDLLLGRLRYRCCPPKQETNKQETKR